MLGVCDGEVEDAAEAGVTHSVGTGELGTSGDADVVREACYACNTTGACQRQAKKGELQRRPTAPLVLTVWVASELP